MYLRIPNNGFFVELELLSTAELNVYIFFQALSNAGPSFHSAVSTVETLPAAPAAVTFLKVVCIIMS